MLKGEISLVGTRPPTPAEVEQYENWHRRRISIKPGITGLWQVSGRNEIDLVAINDLDKRLLIAEIKRNKARISLTELQNKAPRLLEAYRGYEVEYRALSLEDAVEFLG